MLSPTTSQKARKAGQEAELEKKRVHLAAVYGIEYNPGVGTALTNSQGPRKRPDTLVRTPRPSHEAFTAWSPKGLKHSRFVTSTNIKACSMQHLMDRYPEAGTAWEQARSLDSALQTCLADMTKRVTETGSTDYDEMSNKLAWINSKGIFDMFMAIVRSLAVMGYNVREYLTNAVEYDDIYNKTFLLFFTPSQQASILRHGHFVSPVKIGSFSGPVFGSPIPMAALADDGDTFSNNRGRGRGRGRGSGSRKNGWGGGAKSSRGGGNTNSRGGRLAVIKTALAFLRECQFGDMRE